MPLLAAIRAKLGPNLRSLSPNQIFGRLSIRSRLPQLLRHPEIGRSSCHIHVDDLARLQLDDEEGKERTEEEVRYLQEIADPHPCCMIAQKRLPVLAMGLFCANLLHILRSSLNSSYFSVRLKLPVPSVIEHEQMLKALFVKNVLISGAAMNNRFPFHVLEAQFFDQIIALLSRGDGVNACDLVAVCYEIGKEIDSMRYQKASIEVSHVSG